MIDVPVLVRNFRNRSSSNPNQGTDVVDKWRLTRRFFVYDTISGIAESGGYLNNSVPKYVRWAHDVKLKITLDPT